MNFISKPMTEFYKHCLTGAKDAGYLWVVTLLARGADIDGLYSNLHEAWCSLDSITGKQFLFIFAGKENITHDEKWKSKILDRFDSCGAYNDYISFVNPTVDLKSYIYYDWKQDRDRNMENMKENQTSAINSLRRYFSILERDIPCLVVTSTITNENIIIPIPSWCNDIYKFYFKSLFNEIQGILDGMQEASEQIDAWANGASEIKSEIYRINMNDDHKMLVLRNKLISEATSNAEAEYILDYINKKEVSISRSHIENRATRGRLGTLIRLIKDYEVRASKPFDIENIIREKNEREQRKTSLMLELNDVEHRLNELRSDYNSYIAKIDNIIRDSRVTDNLYNRRP